MSWLAERLLGISQLVESRLVKWDEWHTELIGRKSIDRRRRLTECYNLPNIDWQNETNLFFSFLRNLKYLSNICPKYPALPTSTTPSVVQFCKSTFSQLSISVHRLSAIVPFGLSYHSAHRLSVDHQTTASNNQVWVKPNVEKMKEWWVWDDGFEKKEWWVWEDARRKSSAQIFSHSFSSQPSIKGGNFFFFMRLFLDGSKVTLPFRMFIVPHFKKERPIPQHFVI